jgi:hypothetical protein
MAQQTLDAYIINPWALDFLVAIVGQALLPVHFAGILNISPVAEAATDACGMDRQECLSYLTE